jgi:pyruvate/2-oxoglutarate dehydrogenase complex dihydrolipoamide dehydrogenase (E3) component
MKWLFERGLFYKLRHWYFDRKSLWPLLSGLRQLKPQAVKSTEEVVVVGSGIAAFTLLKEIKSLGFTNVRVVVRDALFGGKCVNFGCMPSEFFYQMGGGERLKTFVQSLREITAAQFVALGYPILEDTATAIEGNNLTLKSGKQLRFDRLVLATGSEYEIPQNLHPNCDLGGYWELTSGQLVIVSDGNPTALTMADMASRRGLKPTVVFTGSCPLEHLPSFQYFKKEIEKAGVRILQGSAIVQVDKELRLRSGGQLVRLSFDHLLYAGTGRPSLLPADGEPLSFYEVDLLAGRHLKRPDITVLGDGSGLMSATEAELQALMIARQWTGEQKMSVHDLDQLPLRLHAEKSLAILGTPMDLQKSRWHEFDFRELGWTMISRREGKLWYQFNESTRQIEALHICHAQAGELICIASALMALPITDSRWLTCSVHPSGAEIFKGVATHLNRQLMQKRQSENAVVDHQIRLKLPPLQQLMNRQDLPDWLDEEEWQKGVLSSNPTKYFSLLLGGKKMGVYQSGMNLEHLSHSYDSKTQVTMIQWGDQVVRVDSV